MDHYQKIVSSRGILRSCALHNREPRSSTADVDFGEGVAHLPGGSIYCCTDALATFAEHVMPAFTIPFVLVSGDADTVVSPEGLGADVFDRILSNPMLRRWHAQNLDFADEKLRPIPIGLDYHTMWEHPASFGEPNRTSPFEQEQVLLEIRRRGRPLAERKPQLYCNWHLSIGRPGRVTTSYSHHRADCYEQVDRSLCFFEPGFVQRFHSWTHQAEYAFVLSPDGNGPDTHRTWEALVLGCIPVVRRNCLSALLEDLPVAMVDDWREITPAFLDRTLASLAGRRFDFGKLFLEYWRSEVAGRRHDDVRPQTMEDFRALL